jgi:CRP-like cAMP-binding protein
LPTLPSSAQNRGTRWTDPAPSPGSIRVDDHPSVEDLARAPLLAGLSEADRSVLAEWFFVKEYDAGRTLVGEERAGYAFFIIDQGHVSVTQDGEELRTMGPGDFFGEIAILGKRRRTATVTAVEPVVLWVLFVEEFREMEATRPEVAGALQEAMRQRLAAG